MKIKILWPVFLGLILLATTASAVPNVMNVQGIVKNSEGVPLSSPTVNLKIELMYTHDGTLASLSPIFDQELNGVPLANGVFNCEFGPLPNNILEPNIANYSYLRISVNGTALTPPQRLTSVPYAMVAQNVVGGEGKYLKSVFVQQPTPATEPYLISAQGTDIARGIVANVSAATNPETAVAILGASSGVGVQGEGLIGVEGLSTRVGFAAGVHGRADSGVAGVLGETNLGSGVLGYQKSTEPAIAPASVNVGGQLVPVGAVAGRADGGYVGVSGLSATGFGIYGQTLNVTTHEVAGVGGASLAVGGRGVWGTALLGTGVYGNGAIAGIYGETNGGMGVGGISHGEGGIGIWGVNDNLIATNGVGVKGESKSHNGIGIQGEAIGIGVKGKGTASTLALGIGVKGEGAATGVEGVATSGVGVKGEGMAGGWFEGETHGVRGQATTANGIGIYGINTASGIGVEGEGRIGVHGKGTMGGSFEGTSIGVFGKGAIGGSFEGTNIGVYGNTVAAGNTDSPFKAKTFFFHNVTRNETKILALPDSTCIYGAIAWIPRSGPSGSGASIPVQYENDSRWLAVTNSTSFDDADIVGIVFYGPLPPVR